MAEASGCILLWYDTDAGWSPQHVAESSSRKRRSICGPRFPAESPPPGILPASASKRTAIPRHGSGAVKRSTVASITQT